MKGLFKKNLPHLIAILIFLAISVIYCSPVLQGKVVNQHDVSGWKGMAQQSFEYKEKYGHFPLWTNSLFSGMPAYTIAMEGSRVSIFYLYNVITLGLPKPVNFFFLACLCLYFLCMVLRVRPWIGVLAALAYSFSTYDPIIISAGHDTKMQAMALAPAVIAGIFLIFQRKYLWGVAVFALFFGFQTSFQHVQIVYYTGIIGALIAVAYLIKSVREKTLKHALISYALIIVAAAAGYGVSATSSLLLQEYSKASNRGGNSELTAEKAVAGTPKDGPDAAKQYAFDWSYGIGETMTLIVPGIYGGSNGGKEYKSTHLTEATSLPEDQAIQMANGYSYWGAQARGTSGPVYLGAVICLLFIFGMVYLKGWHKWWLIAATVVGILLAWGKNFAGLNYFLFDHLPLYNKFRTPAMALFIPQFTFAVAAALVLDQLLFSAMPKEDAWKKFKLASYITGGVVAVLVAMYLTLDYKGVSDNNIQENFTYSILNQSAQGGQPTPQMQQQATTMSSAIMSALRQDRKSLFGGDLLRSVVFIALGLLLLGAFIKGKIKKEFAIAGLILLSTFDLLSVGRRYLNDDNYVEKEEFDTFVPTEADKQIMADNNRPFRVFDQTAGDPFSSSRASYFHNSIGGYNPAKIQIYQDLIEHGIGKGNIQVFNMLNTRYVIAQNPANGQPAVQTNPTAYGPAWLVKAVKTVPNADAEMAGLTADLKDTAIVQQHFAGKLAAFSYDSAATIRVTDYANDTIKYDFKAASPQFAVFSEVYYPYGWNAYIDGKKSEYVKTNFALRGMNVPAGNHTITFIFEPALYETSLLLTSLSSVIIFLLLAAAVFFEVRKKRGEPGKAA